MRALLPALVSLAAASFLAATAGAQSTPAPGQVINAVLESRAIAEPLERELETAARRGTVWVGYQVPSIGGRHQTCVPYAADGIARVMLEAPKEFAVLIRFEAGKVSKVRTSTPECVVDAGGLPVIWLQGVRPTDSVRWFVATINAMPRTRDQRGGNLLDAALSALAWHAGDEATRAIVTLARSDASANVRSRSLFWLAQRASSDAAATIRAAVDANPEVEVKRKAVFALSQLPADQGIPLLIQVARSHPNREVQRQAMFWLGQSNDPRATSFFEEVLTRVS